MLVVDEDVVVTAGLSGATTMGAGTMSEDTGVTVVFVGVTIGVEVKGTGSRTTTASVDTTGAGTHVAVDDA